jgi:hypothetical protein
MYQKFKVPYQLNIFQEPNDQKFLDELFSKLTDFTLFFSFLFLPPIFNFLALPLCTG